MVEVLTGRYSRPSDLYWLSLLRLGREHHWRRRQQLDAFASKADWQARCKVVRERFRAALGPMPDRTPLNPRLVEVLARDDYVVEKLLIESQPNFYVTVNLYRPSALTGRLPAVLNPLGHWQEGKAQEVVQARGIGLARQGYIALLYDPPGQGERSQFWDAATNTDPLPTSIAQHSAACLPCWLIGQTVINHMVWDGVRMLDYLTTRSDVDHTRIGCTGASGGGTFTMFLTAFDARIAAAVPVCSTSTYERMLAQGQIGEPCQDPFRSYPDDLDMADLLMCAVPTPVQIIAATYDFYPLIGAREVYRDLRTCYAAHGVPERAALVEVPAHHGYNQPMREAMYAWFNRWLKGDEGDATEIPYQPEPVERLWCTSTGQVKTSQGGETVLSLNRKRTRALAAPVPTLETSAAAASHRAQVRAAVPEALDYRGGPAASTGTTVGQGTIGSLAIEQVVFETEVDLPVPGLVCQPPGPGPHPALLVLHDRGKDVEIGAEGLIPALVQSGQLVLTVDLPGWGETAWQKQPPLADDDFGLLGNESLLMYACYLLGHWPLARRVTDAIRSIDLLAQRKDVDSTRIGIIGRGAGGLVALHAAALDSRIKAVATYATLASYRTITEADYFTHPASIFLPGVLLRYDLPDLVGALASLPAMIANPVDAVGEPLPPASATETFALSQRMYELLGGAGRLAIRSHLSRPELITALTAWAASL